MIISRRQAYNLNLEPKEVLELKVGQKVYVGLWADKKQRTMELIPSIVTKEAYYNADCDEPDWEIGTSAGATDLYGLFRVPKEKEVAA